jgi:hypothetical protein
MSLWHSCLRLVPVAAVCAAGAWSPVAAQPSEPPLPHVGAASPLPPGEPTWVVNFEQVEARPAPDQDADPVATLKPFTYLDVTGYDGDWAQVYNPRTRTTVFIPSMSIGPVDPPPAYVTADPPPPLETLDQAARALRGTALSYYPTPDQDAQTDTLNLNAPLRLSEVVQGDDGSSWYRTSDGQFVPASSVRVAKPPPRTYAGRWIDVDLNEPAMLVAYQGDQPVLTTLTIHGAGPRPTPVGVFRIQRRVADETMNSDTIGIPRFGPGGYYLQHVLFTQYFTADGASLHYNYWSSNWGYAASHGCLGLTYADSAFLWNWAGLGTLVSIHY